MKKSILIIISLFFISSILTAQSWEFDKVFLDLHAPQSNGTGFHGVAVDPDGNIWMAVYGNLVEEILVDGTDTTWTRPILIMDPNGNPLPFSPLYLLEYSNGSVDTLTDNPRGLNTDKDGNILYTAYNTIYRIDYKTGKGLNKFSPQNGASLTNASQSKADGNIYCGYVVPGGKPIFMLDNDFTLLGNATDSIFYINRSVIVSEDGTDLYTGSTWSGFGVPHFHSDAPGLINFAPVDTLGNWYDFYDETLDSTYDVMLWASTVAIGPDGYLWAGNLRPDWSGPKGGAWYAYDRSTGELMETVGISLGDSTAGGVRSPRGIAWTADGNTMYTCDFDYSVVQVWTKTGTDVSQIGSGLPSDYELGQNYPNPFNPSTVINFSIPESGLVSLKVFNVLGQEVAELVNDVKAAGNYEVSFDASNLTTGMYVYKIQSGNFSATKKMMLVK